MQANLLILHPLEPERAFESDSLIESLRNIGFISEAMDFHGQCHYRPGEDFLQLVTFLGCSPVVSLGEPGITGDDFCHIAIPSPRRTPIVVAGKNAKPPRCPHCRQPDRDWHRQFETGQAVEKQWVCPNCGHTAPAHQLKWRQSAGIARTFIVIWGIFEGEAVPSDQLLSTLEKVSGGPWTYFYYAGEPPL